MKLFSKRYPSVEGKSFLSSSLRSRLQNKIKFIVESNEYIEAFLIVNDEIANKFYFHDESLRQLSQLELGYDITEIIGRKNFDFNQVQYQDIKFFDLIELLVIFSKEDKRTDFIGGLKEIFEEEGGRFTIHNFMIIVKSSTGLRALSHLIKEKALEEKIKGLYPSNEQDVNYQIFAKTSAEVLQFLFSSSEKKSNTKSYAENLCKEVARRWTSKTKLKELAVLLSEAVKQAKSFNNEISNIRHTDRTTIPVDNPGIYKFIWMHNVALIELFILSLPENYIVRQTPTELKNNYLSTYRLKKAPGWIVRKQEDDDIDIEEEIPF